VTERTWLDDEPRATEFFRRSFELVVRGFRRPWLTLLLSLGLALLVGLKLAISKQTYTPHFVLRIEEGTVDPGTAPRMKRRLADYVREGVLTSGPLLELVQRYRLYPKLAQSDPRAALDAFRRDIRVEVYQNYFVEERAPGETPRSARLRVSYKADDRATALAVTRELGELVVRHEQSVRQNQAERAAGDAARARETLESARDNRAREVARKQSEILSEAAPDPERQVELVSLLGSLSALDRDAEEATRRAASLDLGAALERGGVGIHFDVASDASLPSGIERRQWVAVAILAVFILALPIMAATVGAFWPRRNA
jgi:hypothetical protein